MERGTPCLPTEVTGDRKNSVTTNVLSADNTEWWRESIAASRESSVSGSNRPGVVVEVLENAGNGATQKMHVNEK